MPDSQLRASSAEWTISAHAVRHAVDPHPEGPPRWSIEIHRRGEYSGSAFFTFDRGIFDVRIRRHGKRDDAVVPVADLADQLRKAIAQPPVAG